MSFEAIVGLCFLAFIILFYVPPALYFKFGWFNGWFHDVMGWHQPDNSPKWDDGCSAHSKCKWCKKGYYAGQSRKLVLRGGVVV